MCRFERGQSTTVAPASRARRRSSAPAWTMCTSSGGGSPANAPSDGEVGDGDCPGTRVRGSTPSARSTAGQRPLPSRSSASSSSSSATWIDVGAAGGGGGGEDPAQQLGAGRVGGVRGAAPSRATRARRRRRGAASCSRAASASASPVRRLARAEQLVEENARQARGADAGRGASAVAHVADRRGAGAHGRRRAASAAAARRRSGATSARGHHRAGPGDEPVAARHRAGQRRQLQVAVGVHQARAPARPRPAPRARRGELARTLGARAARASDRRRRRPSASAPSAMRRALDRDHPARADDPHAGSRRRRAARSACCGGAGRSRPPRCSARCPRRRA